MDSGPKESNEPILEEFIDEVTAAFREAGLTEGAFDYESTLGTLTHRDGIGLDVHTLYERMRNMPDNVRLGTLRSAAQAMVRCDELPKRWSDAKDTVLPDVKPRIEMAMDQAGRSPHEDAAMRPFAEITPHLIFEVVYPVEGGSLRIPAETYESWGVTPDEVFHQAAVNLSNRSEQQWQTSSDLPGVYRSPWSDGFDASRIMLPQLFGRVPIKGRAVVVLPSPSTLFFADSEDEQGLFNLSLAANRFFGREKMFASFRPLRMHEDGESWENWLPDPEHAAFYPLRMLEILEQIRDYEAQGTLQQKMAPSGADVEPLPPLHLLQTGTGENVTVAVWYSGAPRPLPEADVVVFVRDGTVLGYGTWRTVLEALGDETEAMPVYPARQLTGEMPDDWKLARIPLLPWEGSLPG